MMDAIQRRACDEGGHVIGAVLPKLGIGGDHGCLPTASDLTDGTHPSTPPYCESIATGSQISRAEDPSQARHDQIGNAASSALERPQAFSVSPGSTEPGGDG